jgi:hypothetical protein
MYISTDGQSALTMPKHSLRAETNLRSRPSFRSRLFPSERYVELYVRFVEEGCAWAA